MLISNGSALNILLANNNKILNDVLKETDNKTLNNLLKQDNTSTQVDASKLLKEVLNSLKDGTKSNASLENMLKNSNVFKDLGSVSTNISNLLKNIDSDESLQKFKPLLENFLKSIKDMDSNTLKEQLKNSGIFLENKISNSSNTKLESILQNISNLVKNIDTPQAKEINNLINSIVKNISSPNIATNPQELQNNLKALTTTLQNLNNALNNPQTQNLNTFINELKNIVNQGTMLESKLENINQNQSQTLQNQNLSQNQTQQSQNIQTNQTTPLQNIEIKEFLNTQVKELLNQIKNDLVQNPTLLQNSKTLLPMIDNLLKMPDLFIKNDAVLNQNLQNTLQSNVQTNLLNFSSNFATNLNPLLDSLKEILQSTNPENSKVQEHINSLIKRVENIIQEQINNPNLNTKTNIKFDDDFKSMLLKMQDELSSKTDLKSQESLRAVNNLLTQVDFHQLTSAISNSNFVYIPFLWEMLEDGSIQMKQKEEDKFFCQIKLTLKDFGKVDLMLSLYDENKLDMTIYAQREHFKVAIRDNISKLKQALNGVELIPVNIKLLDMPKEKQEEESKPANIYQNIYNSSNFGNSIDIKA